MMMMMMMMMEVNVEGGGMVAMCTLIFYNYADPDFKLISILYSQRLFYDKTVT